MTKTQKTEMYEKIRQHGENLNLIFNTGLDPVVLCKKLFRIERKANFAATCLLNTNTLHLLELNRFTGYDIKETTEEKQDIFFDKIKKSVYKILGEKAKDVFFINYDARGYSLKLKSDFTASCGVDIYQDWGGYGILAPDFSPVN